MIAAKDFRRLSASQNNMLDGAAFGPLNRVQGGWKDKRGNFFTLRQGDSLIARDLLTLIHRPAYGPALVLTAGGRKLLGMPVVEKD
jgi:hypothetical protein